MHLSRALVRLANIMHCCTSACQSWFSYLQVTDLRLARTLLCRLGRHIRLLRDTVHACTVFQQLAPTRSIITARCYASAVLAMALCLSVCLSQVGVLLKRLIVGSHKEHHTIAQGLQFSCAKDLCEIPRGSPPAGAPNAGAVGQNRRFSTNSWLYLENGTRQTHGFY